MTSRQMLEALLIELDKVNAPSLLLDDYNYFINKAIYQYVNKSYGAIEINQQYTDNLRVLKSTAILTPHESNLYTSEYSKSLHGATFEVDLPADYLHMLNCICIYEANGKSGCGNNYRSYAAKRLTGDSWSTILTDYYNKPTYKRPYYYLHNVNTNNESLPTNPYNSENPYGTDLNGVYSLTVNLNKESNQFELAGDSNLPRIIMLGGIEESLVEKSSAIRVGNPTNTVRCEIRCGDTKWYTLKEVHVDYIKVPQYVCITQEQMDLTVDTSQIIEFPDYVCQEIVNELVHLVMENTSDSRLNTHIPVSQSIA